MHLGFSSMNTVDDPPPAELAATLEAAGFESLWYGEHSHIPMCRSTPYPAGGDLPDPYKKMMSSFLAEQGVSLLFDPKYPEICPLFINTLENIRPN